VAAAAFGSLTPNTSAVTLITCLPLLYALARLPLHLAESLVLPKPQPAKWDGVERRKPRGPQTETSAPAADRPPPPTSGA
jgi:hypothetical protein